jgi:hypothetical protein
VTRGAVRRRAARAAPPRGAARQRGASAERRTDRTARPRPNGPSPQRRALSEPEAGRRAASAASPLLAGGGTAEASSDGDDPPPVMRHVNPPGADSSGHPAALGPSCPGDKIVYLRFVQCTRCRRAFGATCLADPQPPSNLSSPGQDGSPEGPASRSSKCARRQPLHRAYNTYFGGTSPVTTPPPKTGFCVSPVILCQPPPPLRQPPFPPSSTHR